MKHNNPCGAATSDELAVAVRNALEGDPVSAFGCIMASNRTLDAASAEVMCEPGRFIEAVVAPDFSTEALNILATRPKWKNNVRLLRLGALDAPPTAYELRPIDGGCLVQAPDAALDPETDYRVVTKVEPPRDLGDDMAFAWDMVRTVKSNAIVIAKDGMLLGVGAGQMSRVDSVEIALKKAGRPRRRGCASLGRLFFPFPTRSASLRRRESPRSFNPAAASETTK